jgi:hypothetical protein
VTDTNVLLLSQPGPFADPQTEVLRNGARALLAQAVEAEVAALVSCHADKLTNDGRQRLVRHGHLPEREIVTGIGPVAVRCPHVRDRVGEGCERIRFSSAYDLSRVSCIDKNLGVSACLYVANAVRIQGQVPRPGQLALEGRNSIVGVLARESHEHDGRTIR